VEVAKQAVVALFLGPASISIHNNGNVAGEAAFIDLLH
jgi:hypothetical protein